MGSTPDRGHDDGACPSATTPSPVTLAEVPARVPSRVVSSRMSRCTLAAASVKARLMAPAAPVGLRRRSSRGDVIRRSLCSPMTSTAVGATSFCMAGILAQRSYWVQWLSAGGALPIGVQLVGVELSFGMDRPRLQSRTSRAYAAPGTLDRSPNPTTCRPTTGCAGGAPDRSHNRPTRLTHSSNRPADIQPAGRRR